MQIHQGDIQWKLVSYLRENPELFDYKYQLWLNEPLASWDVFDYWEMARVKSMEQKLKKGDVLFDVGTEQGWCNLVYAQIVGAANMVLIEPTEAFWPNIKALWQKNNQDPPLACHCGLISNVSTHEHVLPKHTFPACSEGSLIDRNSYTYIHEHKAAPQITLDRFVELTNIVPDALTIDVEGAELLVLKGAEKTLLSKPMKVWVSEHEDLALRDYATGLNDVAEYMARLGYKREVLGKDHELHVYYGS